MGGFLFDERFGLTGVIPAKNITPAGIGSMTDSELFHAIESGIGKDGQALFPLMPYPAFNRLSDEDLYSIIASIRTLRPIENTVPEAKLKFPVNFLVRTDPQRREPVKDPDRADVYEYGRYLTTAADCITCHSQMVDGELVQGKEYAGGYEFELPTGIVRSANITPDEETGIGSWTQDIFVARFKQYDGADSASLRSEARLSATVMPWTLFAGMTDEDIGAIYKYLRTVPPVKNEVEIFTPHMRK